MADALIYIAPIDPDARHLWRATAAHLGEVVVKLLPATLDTDATIEYGKRLAAVRSPRVVRVYGVSIVPDPDAPERLRLGVMMEPVVGDPLDDRLCGRPFTPEEALRIGLGACAAIRTLHDAGLVHGDLHGRNLLIDDAGDPVAIDTLDAAIAGALAYTWADRHFAKDLHDVRALGDSLLRHTIGGSARLFAYARAMPVEPTLEDVERALTAALST